MSAEQDRSRQDREDEERETRQRIQDRADRLADYTPAGERDPASEYEQARRDVLGLTTPQGAAERILTTPLNVQLTPRQIGRLLGLVALDRSAYMNEPEELAQLEEISAQLSRAVAQIGARP